MILVGSLLLAFLVLPSPWGLVVVVIAGCIEVAQAFAGVWYSRRSRPKVGAETVVGVVVVGREVVAVVGAAGCVVGTVVETVVDLRSITCGFRCGVRAAGAGACVPWRVATTAAAPPAAARTSAAATSAARRFLGG